MLAALAPLQRLISPLASLVGALEDRRPLLYAVGPSAYGPVLIAVSEGRVREVALGVDEKSLVAALKRRFPRAAAAKGDPLFWDAGLEAFLAVEEVTLPDDLEQDAMAPAFEQAVRDQLHEQVGRPTRRKVATLH